MKRKKKSVRKKSNTWALVAAVLVATFSLLFNHLFRITPDKIEGMLDSVETFKTVSEDLVTSLTTTAPEATGVNRSPRQVMDDLDQLKPILDAYFRAYVGNQTEFDDKIEQAGLIVRAADAAIEAKSNELPAEDLFLARMAIFQSLFLVAGMQPDEYSRDLHESAERLLVDPELRQADPLRLFLAYHDLRLHSDSNEVVLQKLEDYSAEQPNDTIAIQLYGLAAEVMKKYGRRSLSELILRQGMQIYQGHEDRSRLVQDLIDFKIEKLADPTL